MNATKPNIQEPKFFLQDELIYFLQKNAQLNLSFTPVKDAGFHYNIRLNICDKIITEYFGIISNPTSETSIQTVSDIIDCKADISNLIGHLQLQQNRIEALERALAQYSPNP